MDSIDSIVVNNNLESLKLLCSCIENRDDVLNHSQRYLEESNGKYLKETIGSNIFQIACIEGSIEIVEYLLSIGYIISANDISTDETLETALHHSVRHGHIDIAKILIANKFNVSNRDNYGQTALHYSVYYNQLNILKYFIENNICSDIYDKDNYGYNILHLACVKGNYDIVKYLISIHYEINYTCQNEISTLCLSVSNGNLEIIKLLIDNNVDVSIQSIYGINALHQAVLSENIEILEFFISKNIFNLCITNLNGENILHLAIKHGCYRIVKYLLSIGFDVNSIDSLGQSYLHLAVLTYKGSFDIIQLLVSYHIDMDIADNSGSKAYHFAVMKCLDVLKYFISKDLFNIYEVHPVFKMNLLHFACMLNNYDVIKYLLSIEYDTNMIFDNDMNALTICVLKNQLDIIKLLVKSNINMFFNFNGVTLLLLTVYSNKLDIMIYLLDLNIYDMYEKDQSGFNILHVASASAQGRKDIVNYLVTIGYNINLTDDYNTSCLHFSCKKGHTNVVKLLIKNGIDISIKDSIGKLAFHYCIQVETLICFTNSSLCNIYDVDNYGNNILHIACMKGNYNIVEYLLSIGYIITLTNDSNKTAIQIAAENNYLELVKLLESILI